MMVFFWASALTQSRKTNISFNPAHILSRARQRLASISCSLTTGSSGNKPCWCCANVVAAKSEWVGNDASGLLIDFSCSDASKFVLNTDTQIWGAWDALSGLQANVSPGEFKKQQMILGLTFSPHGLLGNKSLRSFFQPTAHILFDPAHVILANGTFSWSLWEFVERLHTLTKGRLTWDSLRTFITEIDWRIPAPKGENMAVKAKAALFNADRVKASRQSDGHVYKGSVGELLSLCRCSRYFAEAVVDGVVESMGDACAAFKLACDVVEAVFCSQGVVTTAGEQQLSKLLKESFDAHFAAYPDSAAKPKWRMLGHLARFPYRSLHRRFAEPRGIHI